MSWEVTIRYSKIRYDNVTLDRSYRSLHVVKEYAKERGSGPCKTNIIVAAPGIFEGGGAGSPKR